MLIHFFAAGKGDIAASPKVDDVKDGHISTVCKAAEGTEQHYNAANEEDVTAPPKLDNVTDGQLSAVSTVHIHVWVIPCEIIRHVIHHVSDLSQIWV